MIYLDNSATTTIDPEVLDEMMPWLQNNYGNASSVYALGRQARVAIELARADFATVIGAHPAEVIFTSGGTESNNAVLKSVVQDSKLASTVIHSTISITQYCIRLPRCNSKACLYMRQQYRNTDM